jgi:hypothetical protein
MAEDEVKVMLDNLEVEGFKIKAWGLVQLAQLSPCFERITNRLSERKISLVGLRDGEEIAAWLAKNSKDLIFSILPEMPELLVAALGITLEEVDKIPPTKAFTIVMAIANVNLTHLKNLQGPVQEIAKEIVSDALLNS